MSPPQLFLFTLSSAGVLTGCSAPPLAMDASHPASASAPEASMAPARSTLRADANTRRTRELLAQREQQARAAESETPADHTNASPSAPRTSRGSVKGIEGHENH
jgi:hypothetical protein